MIDTATLKQRWDRLREEEPKLRIRDAAGRLGVSEMELVATGIGRDVTRLDGDWKMLVAQLEPLGDVMALTRNDHAVHERTGTYRNVSAGAGSGLVLDEEIDLRIFYSHWRHGFAVAEPMRDSVRRSLQFFDAAGGAVHKIYMVEGSDIATYDALVERFRAGEDAPELVVTPASEPAKEQLPESIDFDGFLDGWRNLQDTHDFFPLLRKYGVSRRQALHHADDDLAHPVALDAPRRILEMASAEELPIMIFVGSPGVIQIHTGRVDRIVETGPWINVLDPRFNLHLRQDGVAEAWVVKKPTRDGIVTSVELLDADGKVVALMFGKRKPGIPESEAWRRLVERLPMSVEAA